MKISALTFFMARAAAQTAEEDAVNAVEAVDNGLAPAESLVTPRSGFPEDYNVNDDYYYYDVLEKSGFGSYGEDYDIDYDYYIDAFGNKKKKNKNKGNKNKGNKNPPPPQPKPQAPKPQPPKTQYIPAPIPSYDSYLNNQKPSTNWAPTGQWQVNSAPATYKPQIVGGAPGKGFNPTLVTSGTAASGTFFGSPSPLIGNGRYCWNCYSRSDETNDAYYNCFNDGAGFLEMCTGEEYFCMWNERRQDGAIYEVGGGCKSAHACLIAMAQNFVFDIDSGEVDPVEVAGVNSQCKSGSRYTYTELAPGDEARYETSLCSWCCDATVPNRFRPSQTDVCNDISVAGSPAYVWNENTTLRTDNFEWFGQRTTSVVGRLFASLYDNGQYHRVFLNNIQVPIGYGMYETFQGNN